MIRNQIIAFHYATNEVAPQAMITEQHLQKMHLLLMKDVETPNMNKGSHGKYRVVALQAKGFPFTVYPV